MALSPELSSRPRVMVVGKDPLVARTIAKLLELDKDISVLGAAPSISTAPIAELRPDVVILDEAGQAVNTAQTLEYLEHVAPASKLCVLEALGGMTLTEVLHTVKHLRPDSQHLANNGDRAPETPPQPDALAALSERELEVVRLVAEGLSNKEISARLSLSDKTVKNHISHILAKMSLNARTQVAVYAIRAGLV
jgi:NarL family two-component system response regulator LiaR